MGGMDVEADIAAKADAVWKGLQARYELWQLIQENKGEGLGATKIAELTDYLYRPEHITRIASGPAPKPPKKRRRAA